MRPGGDVRVSGDRYGPGRARDQPVPRDHRLHVLRRDPPRGSRHFHVTYSGRKASIDIESLEVLSGQLPTPQLRLVRGWAGLHQPDLLENWRRARREEPLERIEPLP